MILSVKKRFPGLLPACLLLAAAFSPAPAGALPPDPGQDDAWFFRAEVREWFTGGSLRYRTISQTPSSWWIPPDDKIFIGSTLDYRNMDSTLPVFSAELRPVRWAALDFEVGDNRFGNGKALIHNWMNANSRVLTFYNDTVWDSPDHRDFAESTARLTGTTRLYSANAYFRVYKTGMRSLHAEYDVRHTLELFAGYSWYKESLGITEGRNVLSVDILPWSRPLEPITGLDSGFAMTWQGWRVGFRERTRLSKAWAFSAKFAFGPTMSYRGHGYWNLSNSGYGDVGSTRIMHKVTGQALELSACAEWNFWKGFQLTAGYMGWFYRLQSGWQETYYENGARSKEKIEDFDAARKGVFTSLSFRF